MNVRRMAVVAALSAAVATGISVPVTAALSSSSSSHHPQQSTVQTYNDGFIDGYCDAATHTVQVFDACRAQMGSGK